MTAVQTVHELTRQLLALLEAAENREAQIEETTRLLAERNFYLPRIQPPFTEEEQQLGKEINEMNRNIDKLLQQISSAVKTDLTEMQTKKRSAEKYSNPYESLQTDGVFYDKRN